MVLLLVRLDLISVLSRKLGITTEPVYYINDTVELSGLTYKAVEVEETNFTENYWGVEKFAEGKFLIVALKVKNNSDEEIGIIGDLFKLRNTEGTTYMPNEALSDLLSDYYTLLFPGEKMNFQVVFDVPAKDVKYNFIISDVDSSTEEKKIILKHICDDTGQSSKSKENKKVTDINDDSKKDRIKTEEQYSSTSPQNTKPINVLEYLLDSIPQHWEKELLNDTDIYINNSYKKREARGKGYNIHSTNGLHVKIFEIEDPYTLSEIIDSGKLENFVEYSSPDIHSEYTFFPSPQSFSMIDLGGNEEVLFVSYGGDGSFLSELYIPLEKSIIKISLFESWWEDNFFEHELTVKKEVLRLALLASSFN